MNKTDAGIIAGYISKEQIVKMFETVRLRSGVDYFSEVSAVNKTMTKGYSWNILYPFRNKKLTHIIKRNMIWEFGDYLPDNLKPEKQMKSGNGIKPRHQEPMFD